MFLITLKERCRFARLIVENSETFPEETLNAAKLRWEECRYGCRNRIIIIIIVISSLQQTETMNNLNQTSLKFAEKCGYI